MQVRRKVLVAGPDDAGTVGRLLADFNAEFDSPSTGAGEFAARFAALLRRVDVLVLLAREAGGSGTARSSGTAVGFAFVTLRPTPYWDGPLAQLEELYVVPGRRDHGIGTEMLLQAVDHVRRRGARELHINVDEVDADARRFYERHGFICIEPDEEFRMLCYLREL